MMPLGTVETEERDGTAAPGLILRRARPALERFRLRALAVVPAELVRDDGDRAAPDPHRRSRRRSQVRDPVNTRHSGGAAADEAGSVRLPVHDRGAMAPSGAPSRRFDDECVRATHQCEQARPEVTYLEGIDAALEL